jgi:hypothetical protein
MSKRFVHIYHVIRSKFCVEAETDAEAIEKADAMLFERRAYNGMIDEGQEPAAMSIPEARTLPEGFCYTEGAEEITGYLIDEAEDEDYERSRFLDQHGNVQPPNCSRTTAITPRERDTILAALRLWQHAQDGSVSLYNKDCDTLQELEDEIACGDHGNPLTNDEIDALCERVNT